MAISSDGTETFTTAADWEASTNPAAMLRHLLSRYRVIEPYDLDLAASSSPPPIFPWWRRRQVRRFFCACCRHIWEHMPHPDSRRAVEVAELCGSATPTAREQVIRRHAEKKAAAVLTCGWLRPTSQTNWPPRLAVWVCGDWVEIGCSVSLFTRDDVKWNPFSPCWQAERLRDSVGNPFRAEVFLPEWRTSLVLQLATAAVTSRDAATGIIDQEQLLVLSDALEDAGCPSQVTVTCSACRGAGAIATPGGGDTYCFACTAPGHGVGSGRRVVNNPLLDRLRAPVRATWAFCPWN